MVEGIATTPIIKTIIPQRKIISRGYLLKKVNNCYVQYTRKITMVLTVLNWISESILPSFHSFQSMTDDH